MTIRFPRIRFRWIGLLLTISVVMVSGRETAQAAKPSRPNILWISCEDISPNLSCYGDRYAVTPNLDALAGQGALFAHCYSHAGVCAVARSGLITGMYPPSIGSQHMRSRIVPPPYVKCFTEYLRAAGYYCTNRSKTDYNFETPLTAWDESSRKTRDWRGRRPGQPFFSVINLTISHEHYIWPSTYKELHHDPKRAILPAYFPDTPVTRRDQARYADIITQMDRQAGEILRRLKADGLENDTIVFFWGDHGAGLPRAKRWVYESGTRVPLIVRWPGRIKPKSVRDDLVGFIDFAPTVLSLAGVKVPSHMQGQVILGDRTAPPRQYIFSYRDRMDEAYDLIRGLRDKRFQYIRNFMPRRTYAQNIGYMNKMPTMQEMRRLYAAGKLKGPQMLFFRQTKPIEELYDLNRDPDEVHNLAGQAKYQKRLARMRTALEQLQVKIGDRGLIPEPVLMEQMRPGGVYAVTKKPAVRVSGGKDGTVQVALDCLTAGASIAYTTGTGRRVHWQLYSKPVRLPARGTLRVVACRLGYRNSPEVRTTLSVP